VGVFDHVAGDVGELQGEAEVGGAAQGLHIPDTHHLRHHHPHHAGHVVGVKQGVLQGAIRPALHIHLEAVQEVQRVARGDAVTQRDPLECGEGRVLHRLSGEGPQGLVLQPLQLGGGEGGGQPDGAVAQDLAVDLVVAMATPGVEQIGVLPHARVEQACGGGEAGRSAFYAGAAGVQNDVAHPPCASSSISEAVALAEPITPGTPAPGWVPAPTM
jgi:hypothetical protein